MISDEQSILDILKQLQAAWNASDSRRWTSFFADDATFRCAVRTLDGSLPVELAAKDGLAIQLRGIRFARPDVAIVFAQMHLDLAPGAPVPAFNTRPTMVVVKEQGK